jgi:hypothetical protein
MGIATATSTPMVNPDLFKTHFRGDTSSPTAITAGLFRDVTIRSGLGVETRARLLGCGYRGPGQRRPSDLFFTTGMVYRSGTEIRRRPIQNPA